MSPSPFSSSLSSSSSPLRSSASLARSATRRLRRAPALALTLALVSAGVAGAAGSAAPAPARADGGLDARLMRYPDVSAAHVAFSHAGDIWLAPKEGGVAWRLSTAPGEETFPRFSPDGAMVAFSGNYDGNVDVYVLPIGGGVPRRLTHHPADDRVVDWTPDGQGVLFASGREAGRDRFEQFFVAPLAGGLPTRVPVPFASFGSLSADGQTLAFTMHPREFATWKRYRGGHASEIWLTRLSDGSSQRISDGSVNDAFPMFVGGRLWFLSDRGEGMRANVHVREADGTIRQVTHFTDLDARFPGAGPSEIVFEHDGHLKLLDVVTEQVRTIHVVVRTDRATLKPRAVNVSDLVSWASPSPSGKRLAVVARGDVFSVPATEGVISNLTASSGSHERTAAWSPDGRTLAYWTDRGGEYELALQPAEGGDERIVTSLGAGFRYAPWWSPDSRRIAFVDQAMRIRVVEIGSGEVTDIDRGLYMFEGELSRFRPSWSPDSRWLAWSRALESGQGAVFLWEAATGTTRQVTSGFHGEESPVFDPAGEHLWLLTSRHFEPTYASFDNSWVYANATQVAGIPLRKDVPSPMAPRNDVEGEDDDEEDENGDGDDGDGNGKGDGKGDGKRGDAAPDGDRALRASPRSDRGSPGRPSRGSGASAKGASAKGAKSSKGSKDSKAKDADGDTPARVEIDLDGFEQRLVVLPPAPGNYTDLAAAEGKVIYRRLPRAGSPRGGGDEGGPATPVLFWDVKEREEKQIVEDADAFELAANGKKALVLSGDDMYVIDVAPDQELEKAAPVSGLEAIVDPMAEWRQIFAEAWRVQRDYFYDPGMHGVDWPAMRQSYGSLLDHAVTRWDLHFILGELIGELNSSHAYRGGGDLERAPERSTGMPGCDFALESGRYRITRILDGAPWDSQARSPLRMPGVDVREGDWLLAVNGRELDPAVEPWAAFEGLAGATVELTVNGRPSLRGARKAVVKLLDSEERLRQIAWVEANRKRVHERSGGRIGYVYVQDTGRQGQSDLARMFYGEHGRPALLVDERFNSGGQIPDRFVELLNRPVTNYWAVRDGRDWQWPPVAHDGPKAMLMNAWSGSGGDCFPFFFREAGLGPLIGRRTWGGLIGISGSPDLVDGGVVTVPTFAIYGREGDWIIENHGVEPDIEVLEDPALMRDGGDPQLDRAIDWLLAELEKTPTRRPARPGYIQR